VLRSLKYVEGRQLSLMPNLDAQSLYRGSDRSFVHEKLPVSREFLKAAEETRTLDLLHGKQTL
jgi:hypothetical protein